MAVLTGILLAFSALICWGVSDLITKIFLNKDSKWKLLFLGQLFGAVLILIAYLIFGDLSITLSSSLGYLLILGIINFLGMYTFYKALHLKGMALTLPITNSWAFIAVVLSAIFYKEHATLLQYLAIILILFGVFVITFKKEARIFFDNTFIFAIISMIMWGLFFFLLKIPNLIFGAVIVTVSVKLLTSFFSVPILLKNKINLFQTKYTSLFYILIIGILDSVGFLVYTYAMNYSPVSITAPIISATPVLTVFLGVTILKEKLTKRHFIGIAFAVMGLIIISL